MTSQAAERVYRAAPGQPARLTTRLRGETGSRIDWLPQETILFNGAALQRRLEVDLAEDATLLAVEPVVFGRLAMGEDLREGRFFDNITLCRDGATILADATRLEGDITASLSGVATAGGARAMACVIYAAKDAEALLRPVRALLPESSGASLIRPGVLIARLLASDSFDLRRSLIPVLARLNAAALPKTWML